MSEEIKKVKAKMIYKLRGDTAHNWGNLNPILSAREPGLILDENGKTIGFKIGDGITAWNELEYHNINGGGGSVGVEVDQEYNPESNNAQSGKAVAEAIHSAVGDIDTALDNIISIQNTLIGGESE